MSPGVSSNRECVHVCHAGGAGKPAFTSIAAAPDTYRGVYKTQVRIAIQLLELSSN